MFKAKLVLGLIGLAFISAAHAEIVLQPGETRIVRGQYVSCGGGAQQEQAWTCACFRPKGKNVGTVSVYAYDKRDAVEQSTEKCRSTFYDYTLSADPVGCFQTP